MIFEYEVVRLWQRPVEDLLAADIGVLPLALLGKLPKAVSLEDGLAAVAHRVVERLLNEAPLDRAKKLLTEALLLTGLRVKRDTAVGIFRGVQFMQESDTYLMILEEGEEKGQAKQAKRAILLVGEERLGAVDDSVKAQLDQVADLERLDRMIRCAARATAWREILDTP